ncbi:hypothetical protein A3K73_09410 [Candidatus Pacearchaeota archaeon RBG_13_36_9]|nr:MAG: hypothetical protein A3K73_09410 [Candidatus Pacearchaeota archaeon RBG_13_36_9]
MRFYKSKWFWIPLIICFITGIGLQYLEFQGLAENTSNAPPGIIAGLLAGLALGFFFWMIFGRVDKAKIPDNIENGFEFPVGLILTTEVYSPKFATKIADKMNSLTGQNRKAWVSSSISPKLVIYPDRLKYKVISAEKEKKYSDIEMLDVLTGWANEDASGMSLKWGHAMNITLKLKDKNEITLNLHRKSNLIELLKFFKSKNISFSGKAEKMLEDN